jgi:hypothetical protein
MKFFTILYALHPEINYEVYVDTYPNAYECGAKIADYDVSEGWSFHCHKTDERSNPLRPVSRDQN